MAAAISAQNRAGPPIRATPPTPSASQPYTFSFEATEVPELSGELVGKNMVARVLLGLTDDAEDSEDSEDSDDPWNARDAESSEDSGDAKDPEDSKDESKDVTPPSSVQSSLPFATPITQAALSSTETRSDGREAIESDIRRDAIGRFYPEFCVMRTTPALHASASTIVDSPEGTEAFANINVAVDADRHIAEKLVESICALSEIVRTKSGAGQSEYGKFISRGHRTVRNPSRDDLVDCEVNKVDIFVQESVTQASAGGEDLFYWSNALSFVEVKAKDIYDWKDKTIKQSMRYSRKIFQYRPVLSHLLFLTWCGHTVRLWYINAALYGCSRPLDSRDRNDQVEIVKIVQLFSLKKYSSFVSGRWDLTVTRRISIEQDGQADRKHVDVERLRALDIRPGPFRTRTAVFAGADQDDKGWVYMVKLSWVAEHLTPHELATLRDIRQDFGEDLESQLPLLPIPIGLAKLPAGFPGTTSELTTISSAASVFPARNLCALVTRQPIGDYIGRQVLPRNIVRIHRQLADVLLKLADKGYHYRDLNDGNVRLLRGTKDVLYLTDFGNISKDLSRRGHQDKSDAAVTIDRAKDDTRSATPLFVPSCYAVAKAASEDWDLAVAKAAERAAEISRIGSEAARGQITSDSLQPVVDAVLEQVEDLHEALRKSNVSSHRYIDDMEGALYLHLWSMALNRGLFKLDEVELSRKLRDDKTDLWGSAHRWEKLMKDYCKTAGKKWRQLMLSLRKVVYEARRDLTADLSKPFNPKGKASLKTLKEDLEKWRSKDNDMGADATAIIINGLWQDKGILDDKQKLQDIEKKCFNECIRLLQEAGDTMPEVPRSKHIKKRRR